MAHKMLRSDFLGQTLERSSQLAPSTLPAQVQTQALFGKNTQKQAKSAPKKAGSQLKGVVQKAQSKTQKPSLPSLPSPAKSSPAKSAPAKKASSAVSKAAKNAKASKGWFGGAGGVAGQQGLNKWYGPNRALFLPDGLLDRSDVPSWLDGTKPGDYGYDPLSLGKDPAALQKYQVNEVLHARWAMLAAAGIIIPEGLQANGADLRGGTWFETGAEMLNGGTLNYFAVPWVIVNNPLPLIVVTAIEVVLLGAVERFRSSKEGPPGYSPGVGKFDSNIFNSLDQLYPGGPFDPLGLADDPEVFQELKVKEIKNGRLAMISVLGFAAQGYVTGEGPYANWAKHVSDPFGYNLLTILGNEDRLPTL